MSAIAMLDASTFRDMKVQPELKVTESVFVGGGEGGGGVGDGGGGDGNGGDGCGDGEGGEEREARTFT